VPFGVKILKGEREERGKYERKWKIEERKGEI
jgi:hypothetical protein